MLCVLVPEHIKGLLNEVLAGGLTQRLLINELKFLQKMLRRSRIKRAIDLIEVDPTSLIPSNGIMESGLTKVGRYIETTCTSSD